jgi:hypothetical protein
MEDKDVFTLRYAGGTQKYMRVLTGGMRLSKNEEEKSEKLAMDVKRSFPSLQALGKSHDVIVLPKDYVREE